MNTTDKFISKDGVLMRNPNYIAPGNTVPKSSTAKNSIDYPSTKDDLILAQDLTEANGKQFEIPVATAVALEAIVDDSILSKFNNSNRSSSYIY